MASRRCRSSSPRPSRTGRSGWGHRPPASPATACCWRTGPRLPADAVVVATGAAAAAALLPGLTVPATRTVTTYYHAAPVSPLAEPTLLVDTARAVLNSCVLTEVGPRLRRRRPRADLDLGARRRGRPGRAGRPGPPGGAVPGRHRRVGAPGQLHGRGRAARDARAAPAQPAARVGPGRYVCGDHRATSSVQGALASGARAAREVRADAACPAPPSDPAIPPAPRMLPRPTRRCPVGTRAHFALQMRNQCPRLTDMSVKDEC